MQRPLSTKVERARAVLVGIQLPELSEQQVSSSLDELQRLCETLGLDPIARLTQRRGSTGRATVLGAGKLRELAHLTGGGGVVPSRVPDWRRRRGSGEAEEVDGDEAVESHPDEGVTDGASGDAESATVVVFDHDLTPGQLRNLEGATGAEVLDRSSVILHIFQRRARSREARLQVEIAQLEYLTPRLRATGGGRDRQQGGIGGRGGPGEWTLELDRRRVSDRIVELRRELAIVEAQTAVRRERRSIANMVALVGYTNAGKSTLMRSLTGAEVLVEDRLFATLDTTVRVLYPPVVPRILISDTVGFIDRLPHDLVASFRSTLAEAREADLLLHVVDGSDPAFRDQLRVTRQVLSELGAGDRPALLVLNKVDRIDADERARLAAEFPEGVLVSALDPADMARLHAAIVDRFEREMVEAELFVAYAAARRVHEIHEQARVLSETHEDDGTRLRVRAPAATIEKLRAG